MTGFEPWIFVVVNDRFTNCATTTAQKSTEQINATTLCDVIGANFSNDPSYLSKSCQRFA